MPQLSRKRSRRNEITAHSLDNEFTQQQNQQQQSVENETLNSVRHSLMDTQPLTQSNSINIPTDSDKGDDEEYSKPPTKKKARSENEVKLTEVGNLDMTESSTLIDDENECETSDDLLNQMIEPSHKPSRTTYSSSISISSQELSQEAHSSVYNRNVYEDEMEDGSQLSLMGPSQLFESRTQMNNIFRNNAQEEAERALGRIGEPGYIKEILLENFMCHRRFEIKFGPRINLIYGPNGSGKSAISNAVQIGLGGRAATTNRAKGLVDFIKTGQNKARIVIKISNESDIKELRYCPDKYGKVIVIERVLNSSGSGGYKIRNGQTNQVISEKKDELENIKKHFSILIDNPICVLTQETSKQFLNSKKPQEKFELFNKATQLEDLYNDYKLAKENKNKAAAMVTEKENMLSLIRKKLEEQSRLVKIIDILKNSVTQIEKLNNEAIWASINEKQDQLNNLSEKLNEHVQKCAKSHKEIDELTDAIKEFDEKKNELNSQLENITEQARIANEEYKTIKKVRDEKRSELATKESNRKVRRSEMNLLTRQIDDLEKRIGSHNENENNLSNLSKQIEELENAIEEKQCQESEFRQEGQQKTVEVDDLKEQMNRLVDDERMIRAKIQSNNAELERLSRGQQNRLNRYGPRYAEMLDQVKRAYERGNFREKPYGPIGEYIHLEDFNDAVAVESMLKNMIFAFVVDNAQDSKILKQIFSRYFSGNMRQPVVIIRKYTRRHDVSRTEARHPKHKNFLELLNIKEDPVANCLIDHAHVEKILYIADFQESMDLLSRRDTVPPNCIHAYTSGGDIMYPSTGRTEFKIYPNKKKNMAKILVKDYKSSIDNYRKEIEQYNIQQSLNAEKLGNLKREVEQKRNDVDGCFKKANDLKIKIMGMERQLNQLRIKSNDKPVEVMALREEVTKMEEERKEIEEEVKILTEERNTVHNEFLQMENEVDRLAKVVQDIWNSNQPITSEVEKIDDEICRFNQKLIAAKKTCEELNKIKLTYSEKLKGKEDALNDERQAALESTGKVFQTDRSSTDLMFEIKKIEVMISENESMTNPAEQIKILENFHKLSENTKKIEKDLNELLTYFKDLSNSVNERDYVQQKLRSYMVTMVNYYFEEVLAQKGFTGEIMVHFNNTYEDGKLVTRQNTLDVVVRPRDEKQFHSQAGTQATIYSSTKSLSGGERSYSTVAFIIALWELCNSPFKILDEVDVFMDMVTRKIAIDTLIEFAKSKSCKQYIFLSPLRMQTVENDELTKIFMMPEVERPTNN